MNPVSVALIGCGAIAQNGYLPALSLVDEVRCLWLIDAQRGLAQGLANRWKIPHAGEDFGVVLERGDVEAVILAVPNHLHCSMTLEGEKVVTKGSVRVSQPGHWCHKSPMTSTQVKWIWK